MNYSHFAECGVVVSTDDLAVYQYMLDRQHNNRTDKITRSGVEYFALNKGEFLKEYPVFESQSSQWFSTRLRALVSAKMLARMEKGSNMYCFGEAHYRLIGQDAPEIPETIGATTKPQSKPKVKEIGPIKERRSKFWKDLVAFKKENPDKYRKEMYEDFFRYWAESGRATRKIPFEHMRFEAQDYFDFPRRLATWYKNSIQFGNSNTASGVALRDRNYD